MKMGTYPMYSAPAVRCCSKTDEVLAREQPQRGRPSLFPVELRHHIVSVGLEPTTYGLTCTPTGSRSVKSVFGSQEVREKSANESVIQIRSSRTGNPNRQLAGETPVGIEPTSTALQAAASPSGSSVKRSVLARSRTWSSTFAGLCALRHTPRTVVEVSRPGLEPGSGRSECPMLSVAPPG